MARTRPTLPSTASPKAAAAVNKIQPTHPTAEAAGRMHANAHSTTPNSRKK